MKLHGISLGQPWEYPQKGYGLAPPVEWDMTLLGEAASGTRSSDNTYLWWMEIEWKLNGTSMDYGQKIPTSEKNTEVPRIERAKQCPACAQSWKLGHWKGLSWANGPKNPAVSRHVAKIVAHDLLYLSNIHSKKNQYIYIYTHRFKICLWFFTVSIYMYRYIQSICIYTR